MKYSLTHLPLMLVLCAVLALMAHGPIVQPPHYHDFADSRILFGLPNAADVLSNIGFMGVGLWGLLRLWPSRHHPALAAGWSGYRLFLFALMLTAGGSWFYHLAPDNFRLIWDRLPIALACAGLLGAVRAETHPGPRHNGGVMLLSIAAIGSVAWWYLSAPDGNGDLRPYLLLQALPLVLIPLWQAIHQSPRGDKLAFSVAILLYIAAKVAELNDHTILAAMGWISGHTIKHLLATVAAAVVTARLAQRVKALEIPPHRGIAITG
jgi:hypothetical protein